MTEHKETQDMSDELSEEEQKRLQEMRDAEIRRMAEENRRQGVGP